jgi:hypothetical protein
MQEQVYCICTAHFSYYLMQLTGELSHSKSGVITCVSLALFPHFWLQQRIVVRYVVHAHCPKPRPHLPPAAQCLPEPTAKWLDGRRHAAQRAPSGHSASSRPACRATCSAAYSTDTSWSSRNVNSVFVGRLVSSSPCICATCGGLSISTKQNVFEECSKAIFRGHVALGSRDVGDLEKPVCGFWPLSAVSAYLSRIHSSLWSGYGDHASEVGLTGELFATLSVPNPRVRVWWQIVLVHTTLALSSRANVNTNRTFISHLHRAYSIPLLRSAVKSFRMVRFSKLSTLSMTRPCSFARCRTQMKQ